MTPARDLIAALGLILAACAPVYQPEPALPMPPWPDLTWRHAQTASGEGLHCLSDGDAVKLGRYRVDVEAFDRARREVLR